MNIVSCRSQSVKTSWWKMQMIDKPNTTPIGQDRETVTFKALLYLDVAVLA